MISKPTHLELYVQSKKVFKLYLQSVQIKMNISRWQLILDSGKVSVSPLCLQGDLEGRV